MDAADDEFGMETGGWCSFTNSLPIVYLCMWFNEKSNIMSFVSRQIPPDVQLDTAIVGCNQRKRKVSGNSSIASKNNKQRKSPSETMADE